MNLQNLSLPPSPPSRPGRALAGFLGNARKRLKSAQDGERQDFGLQHRLRQRTRDKALETPIECNHCHTKIPATVALSFEGADYIYHFCGPQCLDAWCKATNAHDK